MDSRTAFVTVNHGISLKNLKKLVMPEELYSNYWWFLFRNRKKYVQIDGTFPQFRDLDIGLPLRSVVGPVLLLTYKTDLTYKQHENWQTDLFADECSILASNQHNLSLAYEKQWHQISKWLSAKKFTLNLEKTFYLKFVGTKSMRNTLRINEKRLKTESSFEFLGIFLDSDCTFKNHVSAFCTSVKEYVICLAFWPMQI